MPAIPIHKNAPIAPVAAKPDGITPQTSDPPPTRTTPASVPASTTTAATSDPPAPQPGARPVAPTASSQPPSTSDGPPAPQPGYIATHVTTETRLGGPPPQTFVPPPSDSQLAGRSTTTSTTSSKPGPTTLNYGPAASQYQAEHSHGAVPTRVSGEERRSLEHPPGYTQGMDNSPYTTGTTGQQAGGDSATDGGIGGAVWGVLGKAGEALKKGEEAAWRAVRNK